MSDGYREVVDIVVKVDQRRGFAMRPSDARALEKATGKTLDEVMSTDDVVEKSQMFAFFELRKRERESTDTPVVDGVYQYRDPAVTWDLAAEVVVEVVTPEDVPRPAPLDDPSS